MKTPPEIFPPIASVLKYIAVSEERWAPGSTPEEAVEELRDAIESDYEEFEPEYVTVYAVSSESGITANVKYEFKWKSP